MKPRPILFCDFDGTICHDRYWRSLNSDSFKKIQHLLFGDDNTYLYKWLRGEYTAEEINEVIARDIGMPYDRLWSIFVEDCRTMRVAKETLIRLSQLRTAYTTILMTVNMDSFSRFTVPALNLDSYFDNISNSYFEGKGKSDNNGEIFTEYARKYGVSLEDCILIDDGFEVCNIFLELGGTAYQVTVNKDIDYYLAFL